jgi:hypothetical protein
LVRAEGSRGKGEEIEEIERDQHCSVGENSPRDSKNSMVSVHYQKGFQSCTTIYLFLHME